MDLKKNRSSSIPESGERSAEYTDLSFMEDLIRIIDLSEFTDEVIAGPIPSAKLSSCASSLDCDDPLISKYYEEEEWLRHPFMASLELEPLTDPCNVLEEHEEKHAESESDGVVVAQVEGGGAGYESSASVSASPVESESTLPRRARSKRSRGKARDLSSWSHGYMHSPQQQEIQVVKREGVKRCTHCGSDKTPQWRMGPDGPKTLCNACGVRFKKGRLCPQYRPANSPTFDASIHSNSHRKVLEMRARLQHLHPHEQSKITTIGDGDDEFSCGRNALSCME